MLQLDGWNILFTVINLLVLYALIRLFLIKPVRNIMEQRKKMIEDSVAEANAAKDEAYQMRDEYNAQLQTAADEADRIVAQAREKANTEYDRKVSAASTDIERMHADAKEQIALEQEQAKRQMQSEVASLAMAAAIKVMGDKNTALQDEEAYDAFLRENNG